MSFNRLNNNRLSTYDKWIHYEGGLLKSKYLKEAIFKRIRFYIGLYSNWRFLLMKKMLLVAVGFFYCVVVMSELIGYALSLIPVVSIGGTATYLGLAIADELGRVRPYFIMKKIRFIWGKAKSFIIKYRKVSLFVGVILALSLLSNGQELVIQLLISAAGMAFVVAAVGLGWKIYSKMLRKRKIVVKPLRIIIKSFN